MKIWRYAEICFAIAICHEIVHGVKLIPTKATDNTLKYSRIAYSAFSSLQFINNSTLIFRFKTLKKNGMLFYMDDSGVKEFIDAFLLNGQLRFRLTMGSCRNKQHFINGSFTDLSWHKITLKRISESVIVAVDGRNTSFKLCNRLRKSDFRKHGPLYVSYFPPEEWKHVKWTFRDSRDTAMKLGGFDGCVKTPKYAVGNKKFRRARLLKTERTVPGCRDACKDSSFSGKCYNGGKCVNKIVRRECDCKGTGYHGFNCSEVSIMDSTAGLRLSGQFNSYAEFSGWPMAETSELQFYFKTAVRKPSLLLYQGTGRQAGSRSINDYIEVSLLSNGNAVLQLAGNRCPSVHVSIKKDFIDDAWHKISISRRATQVNFTVDNVPTRLITCEQPPQLSGTNGKPKRSLFIGGIPFQDLENQPAYNKWSQPGLLRKIVDENSWFQGCVALLRYSSTKRPFKNVKLIKSRLVWGNCSGEACSSKLNMCQHGGQCVDLVTKTECDCKETGYYGRHCELSDKLNPTAVINGSKTLATVVPDHTGPFKSDSNSTNDNNKNDNNNNNNNNNNGNDGNSGSPTAREKKDPHHSSSPVPSPGWSLFLFVATMLMRSVVLM